MTRHITPSIGGVVRTQQHMAPQTQMDTIMGKFKSTGILGTPNPNGRKPIFGDFSSFDHMQMRNHIADIDNQFAKLPSKIRAKFRNDPHQLICFVEDPQNLEECQKLGLLPAPSNDLPFEEKEPKQEEPKKAPEPPAQ